MSPRLEDRPELHGPAALEQWDQRLAAADDALAEDQLEFWTNICLCHSLIVEPNPAGGLPVYQVCSSQRQAGSCAALPRGARFAAFSADMFYADAADRDQQAVHARAVARLERWLLRAQPIGVFHLQP